MKTRMLDLLLKTMIVISTVGFILSVRDWIFEGFED